MKNVMRWRVAGLVVGCVALVGQGVWGATPLAGKMPGDSLVYVQWAGAEALKGQYAGSNLQGILDTTTLPEILQKQLSEMKIDGRDGKGLTTEEQAVLGAMWKYPGALGVLPVDLGPMSKGGDILPRMVYLMDAGAEAESVAKELTITLGALKKQQPDMPGMTVQRYDSTVAVIMGTLTAQETAAVESGKGALAGTEFYSKGAAEFPKDAAVGVLVDVPRIVALAEEGIAQQPKVSPEDALYAKNLIDVLGVRGFTTISYSAGFAGKEWSEKTLIGMGKDRHGILALVDMKPLGDEILKMVPKDTPSVNIFRVDLARVFKELRAGIKKTDAAALKDFDKSVQQANNALGIDLETDLFAPMGDTFTLYRTGAAGDQNSAFALVHPLRDGKTMTATVDTLMGFVTAMAKLTNEDVGGGKAWTVEDSQPPISVAVVDEKLIICSRLELEDVVAQLKGKTSILDRPEFGALRKNLPQVAATALDFVDLQAVYAQSSAGIKQLVLAARQEGIEVPPEAIPAPEKIAKYLTPGMSVAWLDDAGYHLEGRSAFPGAGVVGFQQASLTPVAVVGAAAAYPSLVQARQQAMAVREMSGERQMILGITMYSNENGDMLPEDLAQIYAFMGNNPALFVSPRSGTKPLELTAEQRTAAEKDWKAIQKDLNEHCDFVLAATGIKMVNIPKPSQFIIIYPKAAVPLGRGANIGFADGHIEVISASSLKDLVEQNNEARKEIKLPLLKVDESGHIMPK